MAHYEKPRHLGPKIHQVMAECDCDWRDTCQALGYCWAEHNPPPKSGSGFWGIALLILGGAAGTVYFGLLVVAGPCLW